MRILGTFLGAWVLLLLVFVLSLVSARILEDKKAPERTCEAELEHKEVQERLCHGELAVVRSQLAACERKADR